MTSHCWETKIVQLSSRRATNKAFPPRLSVSAVLPTHLAKCHKCLLVAILCILLDELQYFSQSPSSLVPLPPCNLSFCHWGNSASPLWSGNCEVIIFSLLRAKRLCLHFVFGCATWRDTNLLSAAEWSSSSHYFTQALHPCTRAFFSSPIL